MNFVKFNFSPSVLVGFPENGGRECSFQRKTEIASIQAKQYSANMKIIEN